MLGVGRRALLVAVCCLLVNGVSSAKRRGLQQETVDRANAALLRENTHREALLPEEVVGEIFKIEYKGVSGDENTVELVDVDTIDIPPIEMGAAAGGQNLIFCPGNPVYGNITIRAVKGSEIAKINQAWWQDALKLGSAAQTDIVVTLMTKEGVPARQWKIFGAWPVMFDHGDFNPATKTASEVIVCKMSRVELAPVSSKPPQANAEADFGITIIEGTDGTAVEDTAWDECSGGALSLSAGVAPECAAAGMTLMPNTAVTELALRGPVASGRAALDSAVSSALRPDAMDPDLVKMDAAIKEMETTLALLREQRRLRSERARKRMVRVRAMRLTEDTQWGYADAFVTAYEFPKLGRAAAPDGQPLVETVRFQALALEGK